MTFSPSITPLFLACLFAGFACLLCLFSAWWLRREMSRIPRTPEPDAAIPQAIAELRCQVKQLALRHEEEEQRQSASVEWTAAEASSVNLNRRGQVLRLYRRGDSVAHIAATLGLSTGEVALIVKVQEMIPPNRIPLNRASEL